MCDDMFQGYCLCYKLMVQGRARVLSSNVMTVC